MHFIRMFATPMTIFSSIIVLFSGLWMFFFNKNHALEEIHSKVGLLFFIAVVFHIIINQFTFFKWLKNKTAYISALIVVLLTIVVFLIENNSGGKQVPPGLIFRKMESAQVSDMCRTFKTDCIKIMEEMRNDSVNIESFDITLKELAAKNNTEPRQLLHYFFSDKGNRGK
jgi:hypothetical protein